MSKDYCPVWKTMDGYEHVLICHEQIPVVLAVAHLTSKIYLYDPGTGTASANALCLNPDGHSLLSTTARSRCE